MHAAVELNLALILFAPWFLILGTLFWIYPQAPRTSARRAFDSGSLLLALLASVLAMRWGFRNADPLWGAMWKQVLATALCYGVFLSVLVIAVKLRGRWLQSLQGRIGTAT